MEIAAQNMANAVLRRALETHGHRYTAQRAAVYENLRNVSTHPTADEIFTQVREVMPDISLATVYKALEAFVAAGVARRLTLGAGPSRYDARTDDHHHVRCLGCGIVRDVGGTHDSKLIEGFKAEDDFEILDYRLELLGYCPTCRS